MGTVALHFIVCICPQTSVETTQPSTDMSVLPTTSANLLSPRYDEQNTATSEQELEEARLRQQLIAREELERIEIMRLEQQRLEVALAEAKSRLEQQDRMLREQHAAQVLSRYAYKCVFKTSFL